MKIKSQISANFDEVVDINDLTNYIKRDIDLSMKKHMGAVTFWFKADNEDEVSLIEMLYNQLNDTFKVFVDLHNNIFSVKW